MKRNNFIRNCTALMVVVGAIITGHVPSEVRASKVASMCAGPFEAQLPGAMPETGAVRLAGIELPPGRVSDNGRFWLADAPSAAPNSDWAAFAKAFPSTGLWPLMLSYRTEDLRPPSAPSGADDENVSTLLKQRWNAVLEILGEDPEEFLKPLSIEFPGLAETQDRCLFNALDEVAQGRRLVGRLALVPVEHAADAIAQIGWAGSQDLSPEDVSAILRSWENRAGVYPVALGPQVLEVVVERPPSAESDRLRWIAERLSFNYNTLLDFENLQQVAELPDEPMLIFAW